MGLGIALLIINSANEVTFEDGESLVEYGRVFGVVYLGREAARLVDRDAVAVDEGMFWSVFMLIFYNVRRSRLTASFDSWNHES